MNNENQFSKNKDENFSKVQSYIFEPLFKIFSDFFFILDINATILEISDNILEILNVNDKKEIIGKNFYDLIDHASIKEFKEDFLELLNDGNINEKLYKIRKKTGETFFGKVSACIIKNVEGEQKYVIARFKDIQEEEILKSELNKSREMFQLVLDNIPQFIFWKDINSIYLGCNKNFARIAGVGDPKNIIGKTDYNLPWKVSQAESFYEIDRFVMESNKPEYHIIEAQSQADGKQAWLDTNKIPLHNSKGEVVGLLGTFEDITERILAKNELEKSEKKYRESYNRANFYKDIFSHDITNILQNIGSANDLINIFLNKPEKHKDMTFLVEITREQVLRGAKLIDNIQKLSQIEDTWIPLKPVNLSNHLYKSVKKIKKWVLYPNLNINIDLHSPNIYVHANELLTDVFENILINAVKYNDNVLKDVVIRTHKILKNDKNFIKVEFIDNGRGIEDSRKEEIFLRAYNKDKSISGLGLGLSLVKKIIDSYNGKIWAENRIKGDPSKGSNFIILIPEI